MLFSREITIPPDTSPDNPQRTILRVTSGVIRHVWLRWRWGIGNLGGLRGYYQEFQYWPISLNQWLPSSDRALDFEESLVIQTDPSSIVLETYNLDDLFDHTVFFALNILRPSISEQAEGLLEFLERGALDG
jgi:hypothetical protein